MALYDLISKQLDVTSAAPVATGQYTESATRTAKAASGKAVGPQPAGTPALAERAIGVAQREASKSQQMVGKTQQVQLGAEKEAIATQAGQAKTRLKVEGETAQKSMAADEVSAAMARQQELALSKDKMTAQEMMQIREVNNKFAQEVKKSTLDRGLAEDDIFKEFKQSTQELEYRRDAASLEQHAFNLFMRDQDYLSELDRIAKTRDLRSQDKMSEEMTRLILGEDLASALDEMGFKKDYNAMQREFNYKLKRLSTDQALDVLSAEARSKSRMMVIEGATKVSQAGAERYSANEQEKKNSPTPPPKGG